MAIIYWLDGDFDHVNSFYEPSQSHIVLAAIVLDLLSGELGTKGFLSYSEKIEV